jgi:Fe-Mn family superoxide dismutase
MRYHHDGHFKTYTEKLNKALEPYPRLHTMPLEMMLSHPQLLPAEARVEILRNGGGYYNHRLFFERIGPPDTPSGPDNKLQYLIERTFGSMDSFKEQFGKSAASVFGSGYTYLVTNSRGELRIINTANQDTPLMSGYTPIILLDVWEHAYYLDYQNRRPEYIGFFWKVVKFS